MTEVRKIPTVAQVDATVLLTGETGTGKEGFARAIHYLSARRGKPFSPVNCGAVPHELLENEFFGHEAGAYTGASSRQAGWIKECDGGTLFLDEVDTLPLPVQTKLLRFIQEREYKPLGSPHVNKADVRIIAATNADLDLAVREGRFRQDLFYRLNIIPITLPPLRERAEDIPLLARHFLAKYADQFDKRIRDFSPEALASLMTCSWPGNVRQLENTIERIVVFAHDEVINEGDVLLGGIGDNAPASLRSAKSKAVADCEKSYILGALIAHNGNVTRAASAAKKHPRAFRQLIYKYAIDLAKLRAR
jgi:transcriptional regulator with PAS, ATPase and Fis domain